MSSTSFVVGFCIYWMKFFLFLQKIVISKSVLGELTTTMSRWIPTYTYQRTYRGPLKAAILDWSGTAADKYVLAPLVAFVEVFKKHKVIHSHLNENVVLMKFHHWLHCKLSKRECHFDKIFTGCTGSCQNDNFRYSQWWIFRQNDIFVSVRQILEISVGDIIISSFLR